MWLKLPENTMTSAKLAGLIFASFWQDYGKGAWTTHTQPMQYTKQYKVIRSDYRQCHGAVKLIAHPSLSKFGKN
jgi:hypothetical protein